MEESAGEQISVSLAAVQSLALVPFEAPPCEPTVEAGMLERFCLQQTTNVWMPLPGLGGNFVMMLACGAGVPSSGLLMYPGLHNYQLWFRSNWNGEVILMTNCDVLKVCPAKQVWPWCSYCNRFLLPAADHRSLPYRKRGWRFSCGSPHKLVHAIRSLGGRSTHVSPRRQTKQ